MQSNVEALRALHATALDERHEVVAVLQDLPGPVRKRVLALLDSVPDLLAELEAARARASVVAAAVALADHVERHVSTGDDRRLGTLLCGYVNAKTDAAKAGKAVE